ncbi:MAG: DUF3429 domain-containing protein [Pseudomonadota bacterium]
MSENWSETTKVQRAAVILGLGGLLPFWALPIIQVVDTGMTQALGQVIAVYGAIICSFMGGTRWGLAMRTPEEGPFAGLLGSVIPPLLGWAVVSAPVVGVSALDDPKKQLLLIVALLAYQLLEDWRSARKDLISGWYIRLRMTLVTGVTTPIILTLLIASVTR